MGIESFESRLDYIGNPCLKFNRRKDYIHPGCFASLVFSSVHFVCVGTDTQNSGPQAPLIEPFLFLDSLVEFSKADNPYLNKIKEITLQRVCCGITARS